MFIDRARIKVQGGAGGRGCTSFRRESFVPRGGPDGGDGGHGGNVVLCATKRLSSLLDLSYRALWAAERGAHGMGANKTGATGEDLVIEVPCGTAVFDAETGDQLADLLEPGDRFVAAKGGRGGKGNARFSTSTNRAPKFSELGEPGAECELRLELKLIADVGTVGLPNAGKSTLLSHISAAHPKIADYPFTTLAPNLGVVSLNGFRTMTVADIPGIIEGASEGKGLGLDFLRHIERTRVLLFLIDAGDPDPVQTCHTLEQELDAYSPVFRSRPRVYALNKCDVTENRERFEELRAQFDQPFLISGATGENLPELLEALWQRVERAKLEEAGEILPEPEHIYQFEAPFTIERSPDGGFVVDSPRAARAVYMTDFENPQGVTHLQHVLGKMGIFRALKRLGAKPGQTIHIGGVELEYQDE